MKNILTDYSSRVAVAIVFLLTMPEIMNCIYQAMALGILN